MTPSDLALAAITTAIGAIIGLAISFYFFHRGTARQKIVISLEQLAHIDPSTVGVQVEMKVGTKAVTNLLLIEIIVTNHGPGDVLVADADDLTNTHLDHASNYRSTFAHSQIRGIPMDRSRPLT